MPTYNLYIAGNKNSNYAKSIEVKIVELGLTGRVKLLGEVSEEEKNWLYKNCNAFVFPSLSEGFGLPVVEAMHFGKPIITSKITSLPEIGGKLTSLINSFDAEEIKSVIEKCISEHSEDKKNALIKRASSFSWNNAAESYISFYKTIIQLN